VQKTENVGRTSHVCFLRKKKIQEKEENKTKKSHLSSSNYIDSFGKCGKTLDIATRDGQLLSDGRCAPYAKITK